MGARVKRRRPDPRVSVFCRCGAQWHGRYAVQNPVIPFHAARCGAPIDAAAFTARGHVVREPKAWARAREAAARAGS